MQGSGSHACFISFPKFAKIERPLPTPTPTPTSTSTFLSFPFLYIDQLNMDKQASLAQFDANTQGVDFVWVLFTTYIGTNLVRIVPVAEFKRLLERNQGISVPRSVLYLLPHDGFANGGAPTGAFFLQPDVRFLITPYLDSNKALAMSTWTDKENVPMAECARSKLDSLTQLVEEKSSCSVLVGFELEFCLLREKKTLPNGQVEYEKVNTNHSWCTIPREDEPLLALLEEAALALQSVGIRLQQFHAELGPAQWEFILPPDSPLKAVDALVLARQVVMKIATRHGYRATLHPRLSPQAIGTGAHVHVSLNPNPSSNSEKEELPKVESFFAGLIDNFTSIAAFTLSQEISYDRVQGGIGSGGDYVCWGWENKEAILRRISSTRFEVKMMDGLANPYLGLCALLAAGLDGLFRGSALRAGPCPIAPNSMSEQERDALGIKDKMPGGLTESLECLEGNERLRDILSDALVSTYLTVKRCELEVVKQMTPEEQRAWFISTY